MYKSLTKEVFDTNHLHFNEYRKIQLPSGGLRLSINNFCNLKCTYCHNEGQTNFKKHIIQDNDFQYIASHARNYGIYNIRLTGGEPTLHPSLYQFVELLKNKYEYPVVGINTNAVEIKELINISSKGLIDQVVVGLDYNASDKSKNSGCGISSNEIKNNIKDLVKHKTEVEVTCVVHENIDDIFSLIEWCFNNNLEIKLIEPTNCRGSDSFTTNSHLEFLHLINKVIAHFSLRLGYDHVLKEYFATADGKNIKFYHSHCSIDECHACLYLPLRISSRGNCKPCLFSEVKFNLLEPNFHINFSKSILHLFESKLNLMPNKTLNTDSLKLAG